MATYTLTGSATDNLVGAANVADVFLLGAAGRLVGTDTVQGGAGNVIDTLRVTATLSLNAAAFTNVRGIERLQLAAAGGADVVLNNLMVASTNRPDFQVLGDAGGDTVLGGGVVARAMLLDAGDGNDLLEGGGGADILRPGNGADTVRGGGGTDTVEIAVADLGANDRLDGGAGSDVLWLLTAGIVGQAVAGALQGFERIELAPGAGDLRFTLGAGMLIDGDVLTIQGGAGDDTLAAVNAGFATTLLGLDGDDRLTGGAFGDTLLGGAGQDNLRGLDSADVLEGGEGDDRLVGGDGDDSLLGGAGDDVLSGGAGADTLDFGAGVDRADGGTGNDLYLVAISEATANDLIADSAGSADKAVFTGPGDLFLFGSLGNRILGIEHFVLGGGNDAFIQGNAVGDSAGANVVTVEGGAGNDLLSVVSVSRLTTPLAFVLLGQDGNDTLLGGRGADTLAGGAGMNDLSGGEANDLLLVQAEGLSAASALDGGAGSADVLRFVGNAPVAAAALGGVAGVEVIELADGGQDITVPGALADALGFTMMTIRGGDGDDSVDVSGFAASRRVTVELGDGDDVLVGGAGNDSIFAGGGVDDIRVGDGSNRVTFDIGELTALDTVQAGTAATFDTLVIGVGAGRTLPQSAFLGVSGFDTFNLEGAAGSAARLPSTLVTQSGQASVSVNVTGEGMVVDGRAISQAFRLNGGNGVDVLFGGAGADTLIGNGGDDTMIGGTGGDRIFLGGTTDRNVALIRAVTDGTADINTTVSTAGADSVDGTQLDDNLIAVDSVALGLSGTTTLYIGNGQNLGLGFPANVLPTQYEIAGDNFGSLTAVRNAVGARLVSNDPAVFEKLILVIGGASNTRFGVYYFEDRDHNTTVDSTDILRLLAIGTGDVPSFGGSSGFRLLGDFDIG